MESKQQLQERRQRVVEEMMHMESMKRGTLNEQYLRVPHKGAKEPALRGPYYVLSRNEHGRTVSERVPAAEVERVRQGRPFLVFGDGLLTACKPISRP